MGKTLFDKVWDKHVVRSIEDGPDVLFIDRHMVHEVTSPVAFRGLENRKLKVLFPKKTFATADHNTPTLNQHLPVKDPLSSKQLQALEENAKKHNISEATLRVKKHRAMQALRKKVLKVCSCFKDSKIDKPKDDSCGCQATNQMKK